MQFLNEWGDRQVVPYRIAHNSSVRVDGKNDTCTVYVCYHWYIYMQCIYMYMYVHMDSYMYIVKVICNACIVQLVCTRDMYTVHNKSLIYALHIERYLFDVRLHDFFVCVYVCVY